MAEDGQVTPEKQLLNLIEGSGKEAGGGGKLLRGARLKWSLSGFFSPEALRGSFLGRISFFRRFAQRRLFSSRHPLSLAPLNKALFLIVVCFFLYVTGDTLASAISLMHPPNFAFQKERSVTGAAQAVSPLKDETHYLQKISARDIFREGRLALKEAADRPALPESSEVIQNLSLVGISWSSSPDVIIEDKARQRTFFLKQGQGMAGGVIVKRVFKDKVVLSYGGEDFELK